MIHHCQLSKIIASPIRSLLQNGHLNVQFLKDVCIHIDCKIKCLACYIWGKCCYIDFLFTVRNRVKENVASGKQTQYCTTKKIMVILAAVMSPSLESSLGSHCTRLEISLPKIEWFPGTRDFQC